MEFLSFTSPTGVFQTRRCRHRTSVGRIILKQYAQIIKDIGTHKMIVALTNTNAFRTPTAHTIAP